jgi:exosortase E/protease (VPEID-CTERM system)
LIPLSVAAMWFANAVRIAALIVIGDRYSPQLAVGGFHSQAGALLFAAVGLVLIAASQRLTFFSRRQELPTASSAAAPWLMPFLVLLAANMICGAVTEGFDLLYPIRVVAVGMVIWFYRKRYAARLWSWDWVAVGVGAAVFLMWLAFEPLAPNASPVAADPSHLGPIVGSVWIMFRVLGSVVTVPIAEELAFRGFLTRRLIAKDFVSVPFERLTFVSLLVPSIAFGLLHGRWLAGTLAGVAFALVLWRRGRIGDAIVSHATANGLIAAYVLTTGAWQLWT